MPSLPRSPGFRHVRLKWASSSARRRNATLRPGVAPPMRWLPMELSSQRSSRRSRQTIMLPVSWSDFTFKAVNTAYHSSGSYLDLEGISAVSIRAGRCAGTDSFNHPPFRHNLSIASNTRTNIVFTWAPLSTGLTAICSARNCSTSVCVK